MTKTGKLKLIVGIVLAVAVIVAVIAVPLGSYLPYKARSEAALAAVQKADLETLKSISATLKDGVGLYANGKANVTSEDFTVTAKYGGKYIQAEYKTLSPEDYTVTVPATFADEGGVVTVNYRGKSAEVELALTPLIPVSLAVSEMPYLIAYETGTTFDKTGMKINATYNDGEVREVTGYTAPTEPLTEGQSSVPVSYTEGETTVTCDVPVSVVKGLDNGNITSIDVLGNYEVIVGEKLSTPEVIATYAKTGNRRILDDSEFIFNQTYDSVNVGGQYRSAVTLISDSSIYKEFPVLLSSVYEGEKATALMGSSTSTGVTEWELVDGSYVDSGRTVGFAAFQGAQAKLDKETSVTFTINVAADTEYELYIRANNSYVVASSGEKGHAARELNLSHVMDVSIDGGEARAVDETAILPEMPSGTQDQLFNTYLTTKIATLDLTAGEHTIKLSMHGSEYGETTTYKEPPCSLNLDWIKLSSFGTPDPDACEHDITYISAVEPKCEMAGSIGYYYCSKCLQAYVDKYCIERVVDVSVPALGHDWGEWKSEGAETHSRTCSRCVKTEREAHDIVVTKDGTTHNESCTKCEYSAETAEEVGSVRIVTMPNKTSYTAGETLDLTGMEVHKFCTCGDDLGKVTDYTVTPANGETLSLGANVVISYSADDKTFKVALPIKISEKFEAENATLVGVNKNVNDCDMYSYDNGQFTSDGKGTVLNEVFKVKKTDYDPNNEKSITFNVTSAEAGYADVILRTSNMNWRGINSAVTGTKWDASEYKLGDFYDLYINGVRQSIADSVIVPEVITGDDFDNQEKDTPAWTRTRETFFDVTIKHVKLNAGENAITFRLAYKNDATCNAFGEFGSEMFDYVRVVSYGAESGHVLTHVPAVAPTCETAGNIEHWVCSECGATVNADGDPVVPELPALGHLWAEEWSTDETYHWHVCTRPGCVAAEKIEHVFEFKYSDSEHWKECICGEKTDTTSHEMSLVVSTKKSVYEIGHEFTKDDFNFAMECECEYSTSTDPTEFEVLSGPVTVGTTFVSVKANGVEYELPVTPIVQIEDTSKVKYSDNYSSHVEIDVYSKDDSGKCGVVTGEKAVVDNGFFKTKTADIASADKYIKFTVTADKAGTYSLSLRIANGKWSGTGMKEAYLANAFDLMVGDSVVEIAEDAIIPGCSGNLGTTPNNPMADCFQTFYTVHLADVELAEGDNVITLKLDTVNAAKEVSTWGETADYKIDYLALSIIA